ncbi:MAG: glycosyltransferase, partial [Bacteroidota bacterium]
MKKISVVVMTLNEAANIGRCLDSVQSIADEIVVVDSGSTDATVAIAQSKGARIVVNAFEGMIEQRCNSVAARSYLQKHSLQSAR